MKLHYGLVAVFATSLIVAVPAVAQSTTDQANQNTGSPSASSAAKSKQPTQGAPAGYKPQQYGAEADKQKTQGAPAGYAPQHYGAGAGKSNQNQ